MKRYVVCALEKLPPGSRRIVNVDGRSFGVFNIDGDLRALRNVCPHHGAPLCLGELTGTMLPSAPNEYRYGKEGRILRCPWHGYEFDVETGRTVYDPGDLRVKVYPVTVEEGDVVVEV